MLKTSSLIPSPGELKRVAVLAGKALFGLFLLASVAACDQGGSLHEAAATNNAEMAVRVIERGNANLNQPAPDGATPLLVAIARRSTEVAGILIEAGADVNRPGPGGITPLHAAAQRGEADIARMLIDAGTALNVRAAIGSPLLYAARFKQVEVARVLLDAGSSVNLQGLPPLGDTPLLAAVMNQHTEMVSLMLSYGADPNMTMRDGFTAMDHASGRDQEIIGLIGAAGGRCSRLC